MAPFTRLRSHPERRLHYTSIARTVTDGILTHLKSPSVQDAAALRQSKEPEPRERTPSSHEKLAHRVNSGAITKPSKQPKQVPKRASKLEKKERPAKQECSICAITKDTSRSFKATKETNACQHFATICSWCIHKMLKTKVAERQFSVAELTCPFPDCDQVLRFTTLKKIVNKAVFHE